MSNDVLNFRVEYHFNSEEPVYLAKTVGVELVAEGKTIQQAVENLKAAVELYFTANNSSVPRLVAYDMEKHLV